MQSSNFLTIQPNIPLPESEVLMSIRALSTRCLGSIAVSLFPLLMITGCSPAEHDAVVASVGKESITLGQYEQLYAKNNTAADAGAKATEQDRESFLDLLVNFRLKIQDAYHEGLDRRPDLVSELEQYRGSLCSSYLLDRDVVNPGLRRLYQQRAEEYRAKHIMISLKATASPADSALAYQKAMMILGLLHKGASFDSLAMAYSEDPSVKLNKGDLYYFTVGTMVPQFEDAVLTMKVGEISSAPVRTPYGLHIIKLTDRKPSEGEIRCSHIMIQFTGPNPSPADTLAAYTRILAIRDSLDRGADFADLAKRYSTDPGSNAKGGDLGWFSRRRWILPFDEIAFTLQPNQVSGIVRTAYGYHIIKCTGRRPPKTFDEAREDLKPVYQKTRFQDDEQKYVNALKQQLRFTRIDSTLARFVADCDSTKTTRDSGWCAGVSAALGSQPAFFIQDRPVSVDSLISIIGSRPDLYTSPVKGLRGILDRLAENLVFSARSESLEKEDPKFASIIRDYKEGLLLYQVEQEQVWNRINPSDSSLQLYFSGEREKFAFPERVNVTEIHSPTQAAASTVLRELHKGKSMEEISFSDSVRMSTPTAYAVQFAPRSTSLTTEARRSLAPLVAQTAADSVLRVQVITHPDTTSAKAEQLKLAERRMEAIISYITKTNHLAPARFVRTNRPLAPDTSRASRRGGVSSRVDVEIIGRSALVRGSLTTNLIPVKSDDRSKAADTLSPGGYSSPFPLQGSWVIVRLNGREPARLKTYDEAGPEVASAFQESESHRVEGEWLDRLKKEYPVVEHKELLKEAFAPQQP